jgi:hypothetical protein
MTPQVRTRPHRYSNAAAADDGELAAAASSINGIGVAAAGSGFKPLAPSVPHVLDVHLAQMHVSSAASLGAAAAAAQQRLQHAGHTAGGGLSDSSWSAAAAAVDALDHGMLGASSSWLQPSAEQPWQSQF